MEFEEISVETPLHNCYFCGCDLFIGDEMWTGKFETGRDAKSRILCKDCITKSEVKMKIPYVSINAYRDEEFEL